VEEVWRRGHSQEREEKERRIKYMGRRRIDKGVRIYCM
jgi:hypothetical protein